MSMEDDLFNIPDNDEEMMDNGDDIDDERDKGADNMDVDEDENDNDEDNNDENEEEEDDENDNENGSDEEDNDDDNDEEDGEEEDEDDENEDKFADAQETQGSGALSPQNASRKEKSEFSDSKDDEADKLRQKAADSAEHGANGRQQQGEEIAQRPLLETILEKARTATEFDIIPSVAIPYSSQCHVFAFTDGPKWILTGGEDGFIRKYDFIASIEGKLPLTMAQRHNLVDSITKAGVISLYWENEQPVSRLELLKSNPKLKQSDFSSGSMTYEPKVNPVYALDVERNGYWCVSGLLSGGISLYTMRYNEGNIHHYFHHGPKKQAPVLDGGHSDAVSVLRLNTEQDNMLSGSWDKTIRMWDLNTGKTTSLFQGSSGQISNIQYRPMGLTDLVLAGDEANVPKPEESDVDSLFGSDDEEEGQKPKRPSVSDTSTKAYTNSDVFMSSGIDGTISIWDARGPSVPVLRLGVPEGVPPWCMALTWSNDGDKIYAGRRNSTVEEFLLKMPHKRVKAGHKDAVAPNVLKVLQFPKISGPVTAISVMPNSNFLLCGSSDNIRLYNLLLHDDAEQTTSRKQATPFLIIPGHHGGILSSLYVADSGRFMVSASGNRGWGHSAHTESVLMYEIDF